MIGIRAFQNYQSLPVTAIGNLAIIGSNDIRSGDVLKGVASVRKIGKGCRDLSIVSNRDRQPARPKATGNAKHADRASSGTWELG